MKAIAVYCGASFGTNPIYKQAATTIGTLLAKQNIDIIYGAGNIGMMGAVADASLANGGKVIGVIPQFLVDWEVAHTAIQETYITETMHERKMKIFHLIDSVIALPGGFGTMDELFEMLTWSQLHLHNYPVGILNINGFYDGLLMQLDIMEREGFLRSDVKKLLIVGETPEILLEKMLNASNNPIFKDESKI
jgi:uncharacterized protein (TIGR00730 family)